ncbi:MAG: ABC transporter substrate-binding protein [Spirochaetes bacterium]|nr:ABC transporter substrate-binding protein [Spirochaetota bacterium]
MKKLMVLFLACLMVLSVGAANKDVVLGLSIPVTGAQAAGGQQALYGTTIAVNEVNNAGGLKLSDGFHKVKIVYEDDKGDATLCDTTVRRLVSNGAVAILGPYFSGQTIALDATMRELKVPLVNSATSIKIPLLQNPWIWRCRCDDGINVLILGKAVMTDYKAKFGSLAGLKVGILCANDETGTSAAASYKTYFDKNNVKYYYDTHNKDESDLTAYVQKALAAGCNAWVSSTHDIAAAALAKAMYQLGLRDQIIYMNPILAQVQVLNLMQPEWVEGWGCVTDYAYNDKRPLSAAFSKMWDAAYGKNPVPDVQAALYYSHANIVMHAIKEADSLDSSKIRDAIAKINGFKTVVGMAYADKYTNLIYEISVAKVHNLVPTITSSISMADDLGFEVKK